MMSKSYGPAINRVPEEGSDMTAGVEEANQGEKALRPNHILSALEEVARRIQRGGTRAVINFINIVT